MSNTNALRGRSIEEQEAELEREQLLSNLQDCFHLLGQLAMQGQTAGSRYAHFLSLIEDHAGKLNERQIGLLHMYRGFYENAHPEEQEPVPGVDILPLQPTAKFDPQPTPEEHRTAQVSGM